MRRKISEKKLAIGLMLLVVGSILLTNTTLIDGPVRVSEKRILFSLLAVSSIILSISFIRKSIQKV